MTTTKKRVEELYEQVVSRLGDDQQEGKALLDELLVNFGRAVEGRWRDPFRVRPGPSSIKWQEMADLCAKVDLLRKPPKRLSNRKALEQIAFEGLAKAGTSRYNKDARTKALKWVKTKENQLAEFRVKMRRASEIMSTPNL